MTRNRRAQCLAIGGRNVSQSEGAMSRNRRVQCLAIAHQGIPIVNPPSNESEHFFIKIYLRKQQIESIKNYFKIYLKQKIIIFI